MKLFTLLLLIISLLFVSSSISIFFNLSYKINSINLKIKKYFDSELESALNKNYNSVIKILGLSDLIFGLESFFLAIILFIFNYNLPHPIDKLLYILLILSSIFTNLIFNHKLKKINTRFP